MGAAFLSIFYILPLWDLFLHTQEQLQLCHGKPVFLVALTHKEKEKFVNMRVAMGWKGCYTTEQKVESSY